MSATVLPRAQCCTPSCELGRPRQILVPLLATRIQYGSPAAFQHFTQ